MGNTVWVLAEDEDEDNWDHSLILQQEKSLDKLAENLSVKALSKFYDYSILQEEYGVESETDLFDANELKLSLKAILDSIEQGKALNLTDQNDIREELEDCLVKVNKAQLAGKQVRLAIIP